MVADGLFLRPCDSGRCPTTHHRAHIIHSCPPPRHLPRPGARYPAVVYVSYAAIIAIIYREYLLGIAKLVFISPGRGGFFKIQNPYRNAA